LATQVAGTIPLEKKSMRVDQHMPCGNNTYGNQEQHLVIPGQQKVNNKIDNDRSSLPYKQVNLTNNVLKGILPRTCNLIERNLLFPIQIGNKSKKGKIV
jgi:hypothetical protein